MGDQTVFLKDVFYPASCSLSGGSLGDDRVQKVADLICLSVRKAPGAHAVSERHGNTSNELSQPSHCLCLRGRERKGFGKQRTISMV